MGRPVHKHKEKISLKEILEMKNSTIRNILFAMLGAFLLGYGIDVVSWTLMIFGGMLIVIAFVFVMEEVFDD